MSRVLLFLTYLSVVLPSGLVGAERPSILVILCDDLGYGDLGCYGNPTIKTPNLDRLASQGIRFTDFYSAAPLCSAARAGLLTGRTPNRIGIYDWIPAGNRMHLRTDEIAVPQLLKKAGYATCLSGKWHCNGKFNSSEQPQPDEAGFDHWFATQNNASPTHENPKNFVRNGKAAGQLEGYSCQLVADEAIGWLRARHQAKEKAPFFLYVTFHEPHEPIASPPELVVGYPEARKKGEALYYANVENMDRAVGRLMGALDEFEAAKFQSMRTALVKMYAGSWPKATFGSERVRLAEGTRVFLQMADGTVKFPQLPARFSVNPWAS